MPEQVNSQLDQFGSDAVGKYDNMSEGRNLIVRFV